MSNQPEALRLADALEAGYSNVSVSDHSVPPLPILKSVAELRRLQAERDELLAALRQFAECELDESNCASFEVANGRIRSIARAAIAKAEGKE